MPLFPTPTPSLSTSHWPFQPISRQNAIHAPSASSTSLGLCYSPDHGEGNIDSAIVRARPCVPVDSVPAVRVLPAFDVCMGGPAGCAARARRDCIDLPETHRGWVYQLGYLFFSPMGARLTHLLQETFCTDHEISPSARLHLQTK